MKTNSIYSFIKNKNLSEALNVEGLTHLGTAFGFDLYDARTYAGAQQLKVGDTDQGAGDGWTGNEATFNGHINDTLHLYLFAVENSTETVMGCLNTGSANIELSGKNFRIHANNYSFQDVGGAPSIDDDVILPLFLLPGLTYNGEAGLIIDNNTIVGTYKGLLNPAQLPEQIIIPENITKIKANAFAGYPVQAVVIESNVTEIEANAFNNYEGTIRCAAEKFEDTRWNEHWNGNNTAVVWGIHLTPEEVARREEAARLERERVERERREREEAERRRAELQAAEMLSVLKYKDTGTEIIINGCKYGRENLEIPEEINGKPVTTIAPFAFFDNDKLTSIRLPATIKTIGKGAFYGCTNARIYYPRTATVYTDAFTNTRYVNAF